MSEEASQSPPREYIDRSLKTLIRRAHPAFFRLAGVQVDPGAVRVGDVTISQPEHRADQVFCVGEDDDPRSWAAHIEYQLQPDTRYLPDWFYKNAALTKQLARRVILIGVYLTRVTGRRFLTSIGLRNRDWSMSSVLQRSACGNTPKGFAPGSCQSLRRCSFCARIIPRKRRCRKSGG